MMTIRYFWTRSLLAMVLALTLCLPAYAQEDDNDSGLPLPRFVSLRSDEINVRAGPGMRYSIRWVYHRENLPVEIIQEFDQWREIRDHEDATGWVHKSMLSSARYAMIMKETITLRKDPDVTSAPIIRAEPGVLAKLIACQKEWCRLQIDSRKGWAPKAFLWGAYSEERFE